MLLFLKWMAWRASVLRQIQSKWPLSWPAHGWYHCSRKQCSFKNLPGNVVKPYPPGLFLNWIKPLMSLGPIGSSSNAGYLCSMLFDSKFLKYVRDSTYKVTTIKFAGALSCEWFVSCRVSRSTHSVKIFLLNRALLKNRFDMDNDFEGALFYWRRFSAWAGFLWCCRRCWALKV